MRSQEHWREDYYNTYINVWENNKKMAEQVRGTIQQVPKPREFTKGDKVTYYYSMKVNDVYYSVGTKKPPEPGTLVEFEYETNARGYKDVTKAGIRVIGAGNPTSAVGAAAVGGAKATTLTKDDYWGNKEKRDLEWQKHQRDVVQPKIELQAARNAAIEFVKLLITPVGADKDGVPVTALKLGAQGKREQILFEAVQKYTQEFVNSNKSSENKNNNEQAQSSEDSSPSESDRATDQSDDAWNV